MDPKTAPADSDTPDGTEPDTAPATPAATETGPDKDWQAEAEKWKALSRKHENANTATLRELEQLRHAQMTDSEKAVAEAEERGRQAALATVRTELAEAKLRVAAAGKVADVDALVELVDLNRFVTDDGVDSSAIEVAVERFIKALPAPAQQKFGSVELGSQGDRPRQFTRDDLRSMTPDQIEEARAKGQLDSLLGITP
jgi:hypothetical protein